MFKKLFGKKKPQSLEEAQAIVLENIKEEGLSKDVSKSLDHCLQLLKDTADKEASQDLVKAIFGLIDGQDVRQSAIAFSVLSRLYDEGYVKAEKIDKLISIYASNLEAALPFFQLLDEAVKKGEEGDNEYEADVDGIYNELMADRSQISADVAKAAVLAEQYAQSFINMISSNNNYIQTAKTKLKETIQPIKHYSQGGYWLDRLFDTLFDEAIVVIDVDEHRGFEGRMSGVSDNYQLQHILMGMTELIDNPMITEQALSVAKGTGIHMSNIILEGKWNMYNREIVDEKDWTDIRVGPDKTLELKDLWIWGEGTPKEISIYGGRRVVLLGRPTFKRTNKVQRTFKNLMADVVVEKVLTEDEINIWLGLDKA